MEKKPREIRMCQDCKTQTSVEFNKVASLKNSGLLIFKYNEKLPPIENISTKKKKDDTFILHNAGGKQLERADYISEMCQYRTKCFQCKTVIQKVRSLLDEVKDIKKNEVLGICKHCNRANPLGNCRRCEQIVDKFLCEKTKHKEDRTQRFKRWLFKLNQLLNSILGGNVCRHKLYKDTTSALELEKLLQELKSPLEMRQPEMVEFPSDPDPFRYLTQSKEMLEELLNTLNSDSLKRRSSDSLYVSPSRNATSYVNKHFKDKTYEEKRSMEILTQNAPSMKPELEHKLKSLTRNEKKEKEKGSMEILTQNAPSMKPELEHKLKSLTRNEKKEKKEFIGGAESNKKSESDKKTESKKIKDKDSKKISPAKQLKTNSNVKENLSPDSELKKPNKSELKKQVASEDQMLLKMIKDKEKEKRVKEKTVKMEKVKTFAEIESLPELIIREVVEVVEERSESFFECDHEYNVHPTEMIKKSKIVPFDPRYKDEPPEALPMLYQIKAVYPEPSSKLSTVISTPTSSASGSKDSKIKRKQRVKDDVSRSGVVNYALSNREFIDNGWTVLPTTKIMRRMNIYKMEAASPKYDWFNRHKDSKIMFYDTGEKLAEIDSDGRGKWFYKNGIVALDYYNTQDNEGLRYVIYSSGEEIQNGKKPPITVLAAFDYLGNGVVYDHYGEVRLKYNQSEGMVIDEKIGTPGRWQWHSLNEPSILQPVFIDTFVKERSSCLEELFKHEKSESSRHGREPNEEMLAIELDNLAKAKANKLLQKFKPFKIKMKVLKLNDYFSLRVLDQSNINLLFRDGKVSIKLNLGMLLISSEIVDTVTAGVSEVATPYDRSPPQSASVAEIQRTLSSARRIGKTINRKNIFESTQNPDASNSFN